ncbi:MAG: DUF58 domain-containing protein [Candidatus Sericytochromatia bacterium]
MLKITSPLLILVLTAIFLFLAATNIQGGWLYFVDALLWSAVLMAFVLPLLQLRQLRIKRRFPASPYAGQPLAVSLSLGHASRWPLAFINLEDLSPQELRSGQSPALEAAKGFVVSLAPGETWELAYHFTPPLGGIYHFSEIQTGSFGPLGLLGVYRRQQQPATVVVRPLRPTELMPLLSEEQAQAVQQARRRSSHSEDISHFREYQPGDNTRSIHWKNSAKRQKLIVAEAREEPFEQALVLFDTSQGQDAATFQALVTQAEKVCHSLLEQGLEISCWAQAADYTRWEALALPAPERALSQTREWEKISYWLATLLPDAPQSLAHGLQSQGLRVGERLTILLSSQPDPALLRTLCQGRSPEQSPPLLVFGPQGASLPSELSTQVTFHALSL